MLDRSKKGSHVGMIMSFVIFTFFLFFLYTAIEPSIKIGKDKTYVLDLLEREMVKQVSSNLTTVVLFSTGDCSQVSNSDVGIEDEKAIVLDGEGNPVSSSFSGDDLIVDSFDGIARVFYSSEFSSSTSSSSCGDALIKSIRTEERVFESKIGQLKTDYENDYNTLKKGLDISENDNFDFVFQNANREEIVKTEKNIPDGISVYSRKKRVLYIDENAKLNLGLLIIRAW